MTSTIVWGEGEAKNRGTEAAESHLPLSVNPYQPGTELWVAWRDAWTRATEARVNTA